MRKRRDALTQDGGEADPGDERGGTTNAGPGQGHGNLRGSHERDRRAPVLRGARRASNGSEPRKLGNIGEEADDGSQEEVHLKVLHSKKTVRNQTAQSAQEFSSRHELRCREKLGCATQSKMMQRVHKAAWTKRDADYLSFLAEAERRAVDPDQCLDKNGSDVDDFETQRRCCLERSPECV